MGLESSGRDHIITNKDASDTFIERRLKRKGYTASMIANYIRGWKLPMKKQGI